MNSKMTTNSQLSTNEPKTMKTKTKQTTRTGTEPEKWTSHRGISVGRGKVGMGRKVQGRRRRISRHKIDGERQKKMV